MKPPITVIIIPATGNSGKIGQSIIKTTVSTLIIAIMSIPVRSKIMRLKKPMMRETSRSVNMWNFNSSDDCREALSADIWRNGLNKVRINESIEK
jgi:hypothetical protein